MFLFQGRFVVRHSRGYNQMGMKVTSVDWGPTCTGVFGMGATETNGSITLVVCVLRE